MSVTNAMKHIRSKWQRGESHSLSGGPRSAPETPGRADPLATPADPCNPLTNQPFDLEARKVTAFALELVPVLPCPAQPATEIRSECTDADFRRRSAFRAGRTRKGRVLLPGSCPARSATCSLRVRPIRWTPNSRGCGR